MYSKPNSLPRQATKPSKFPSFCSPCNYFVTRNLELQKTNVIWKNSQHAEMIIAAFGLPAARH
jgi:hypothetical protein